MTAVRIADFYARVPLCTKTAGLDQGIMLSHDAVAVSPWAGLSTGVHEWEPCASPSILSIASHLLLLQMPVHAVDGQQDPSHHLSKF